jgi:hypothetical protein
MLYPLSYEGGDRRSEQRLPSYAGPGATIPGATVGARIPPAVAPAASVNFPRD